MISKNSTIAIEAPAFRPAESSRLGRQDQEVNTRTFAAEIAIALNLPSIAPIILAFSLRSPALLLIGICYLILFGVPGYLLIRKLVEGEIASETETAQYLAAKTIAETLGVAPQTTPSRWDDRGAATTRTSQMPVPDRLRHSA